ncbi:MAG: carbonic anhydrase [Alphaproteobacteria bacterium]
MLDVAELIDGYRRFLATRYPEQAGLYRKLADVGQSPKTMVIACCDSRADPATIFDAAPGQLFVVRNVANLVPSCEREGFYHGTSAALEFAVTGLAVENIVVMGHARCGGVRAFLDGLARPPAQRGFIDRWLSLLTPVGAEVLGDTAGQAIEVRQQALEHASVRHSLRNLESFPFIRERLAAGTLHLYGAFFDIADGRLLGLDRDSGRFTAVE